MAAFVNEARQGVTCWQVEHWKRSGIEHGFLAGDFDIRLPEAQKRFAQLFLSDNQPLLLLEQVHGTEVITLERLPEAGLRIAADAWYVPNPAELPPLCLGIIAADCYPVLIIDPGTDSIAAAHCGWRGTVAGLLPKLLAKVSEGRETLSGVQMAIGPGASAEAYEVDDSVAEQVRSAMKIGDHPDAAVDKVLIATRPGHFLFNLRLLLAMQAEAAGVLESSIYLHPACTILDGEFFSFRRQKALSGRQLSYICSGKNREFS